MATIEMGVRPYVPALGRFLEADPMEGGSSNDYDYVSADPINGRDLNGLCNALSVYCVIGILKGRRTLPTGFQSWLLNVRKGTLAKIGTAAGLRRIRVEGRCSFPASNTGPSWNFLRSCRVHDLGYDLLRYMHYRGQRGSFKTVRRAIDRLFLDDMMAHCRARGSLSCVHAAETYFLGVSAWTKWDADGVPSYRVTHYLT